MKPAADLRALPIDPRLWAQLTAGLSADAIGAFLLLSFHSWMGGQLRRGQLSTIARLTPAAFRDAWHAIGPLFAKRGAAYVPKWIQPLRADKLQIRSSRVAAGHASGRARRLRPAIAPPATAGPRFLKRDRATFGLMARFCELEFFDKFDGGGARPTFDAFKIAAARRFDWRDAPDLPGRVFDGCEAKWRRRHEDAREARHRSARNPTIARHIREIERLREPRGESHTEYIARVIAEGRAARAGGSK